LRTGFANALSLLPYLGGLTRMARHSHHVMGPTVIGSGIVGAWIIASVAALATAASGASDPTEWILLLGGPLAGAVIVAFLLIANVGTLVVQVYVAAVGARQIRWVARLPWAGVLAIALVPGLLLAFRTQWLLAQVATLLGYSGAMFVGMAAVLATDYFVIQRQQVELAHLYARPGQGRYWYHGGVNWLGVAVMAMAAGFYLYLFDPITLRSHSMFRFVGAGIPTVLCAALLYACGAMLLGKAQRCSARPAVVNPTDIDIGV
jgi:nucleobase:cation symporter-1, NCS1 family